ncbi:hypothetical protein BJX65DRAFT_289639 [Aspergillus insuetus]
MAVSYMYEIKVLSGIQPRVKWPNRKYLNQQSFCQRLQATQLTWRHSPVFLANHRCCIWRDGLVTSYILNRSCGEPLATTALRPFFLQLLPMDELGNRGKSVPGEGIGRSFWFWFCYSQGVLLASGVVDYLLSVF